MNPPSPPRGVDPPSPPLQRGKACISCRRRKMRCDGLRPTCTQCIRGDRAMDCEYTDGNRRPRTLDLEEEVARLQSRIQELENPGSTAPSVTLHDPYDTISLDDPAGSSSVYSLQHAIDAVCPYALDMGIFLNLSRLRAQAANVIPALQHSIVLCSSHLIQSPVSHRALAEEPALLSRSLHSLTNALAAANPKLGPQFYMQILQTEVLLAYYLQRICQTPNAQYHANAAMSLAITLGLHMRSSEAPAGGLYNFTANCHPRLPRPSDAVEDQERVDGWWTVYSLVKFLEAVHPGGQAVNTTVRITTPWPRGNMGQSGFEHAGVNVGRGDTIAQFLATPNFNPQTETALGMQARASVLLGEAQALATSCNKDPSLFQSSDFLRAAKALNGLNDLMIMNPVCLTSSGALFFVLHDELVRLRVQRSRQMPGYNPGSSQYAFPDHGGEAEILGALRQLGSAATVFAGQCPLQTSLRAKLETAMSAV
ncbi:hypothetical protein ID866_5052 [Astraeus odoratus]|nr:hypothetical protein ID866_5052 [Astraeus odoratus]